MIIVKTSTIIRRERTWIGTNGNLHKAAHHTTKINNMYI